MGKQYHRWLFTLASLFFALSSLTLAAPAYAASRSSRAAYGLGNQITDVTPALCVDPAITNNMYAVWRDNPSEWGTNANHLELMESANGADFSSSNLVVLSEIAAMGPSMTIFNGKLYIAYVGNDGTVHLGYYQPGSTNLQQEIFLKDNAVNTNTNGNANTDLKATITSFGGKLYVAWVNYSGRDIRVESSADPYNVQAFTNSLTILKDTAAAGVALTGYNGNLYLTYPGQDKAIHQGIFVPGNTNLQSEKKLPQSTTSDVATSATPTSLILAFLNATTHQIQLSTSADDFASSTPAGGITDDQSNTDAVALTYDPALGIEMLFADGYNNGALVLKGPLPGTEPMQPTN